MNVENAPHVSNLMKTAQLCQSFMFFWQTSCSDIMFQIIKITGNNNVDISRPVRDINSASEFCAVVTERWLKTVCVRSSTAVQSHLLCYKQPMQKTCIIPLNNLFHTR